MLTGIVVMVAVIGPFVAPYSPSKSVATPFGTPSADHLLGLDYLGRDVFSRWLSGGRTVMVYATAATLLGVCGGLAIGLITAYRRDWVDGAVMRGTDLLLGFPPLLLFLLVLVTFGNNALPLILVVGAYHAIRMSRVVRSAAQGVMPQGFVEAAQARGDPASRIIVHEVLPNVTNVVLVDAGFRFIYSVIIIASLSFLGFGIQPPAADWGLMVAENRNGLQLNMWASLAPAITLAVLSLGINLVTDVRTRTTSPP